MQKIFLWVIIIGLSMFFSGNIQADSTNNKFEIIKINKIDLFLKNNHTNVYQLKFKTNNGLQMSKNTYVNKMDLINSKQLLITQVNKKQSAYFKINVANKARYVPISKFKDLHFLNIKKIKKVRTVLKVKSKQVYIAKAYGKYILLKNTKLPKLSDQVISNQEITITTKAGTTHSYYEIEKNQIKYLLLKSLAIKLVNKTIADDYTDISTNTTLKPGATLYQFSGSDDDLRITPIKQVKESDFNQYTIQKLTTIEQTNGLTVKYYQVKNLSDKKYYYVAENQLGQKFEKDDNVTTTLLENPLDTRSLINSALVDNDDAPDAVKAPIEDTSGDAKYSMSPNFELKNGHYENEPNNYEVKFVKNTQSAMLTTSLFLPTASAESDDHTSNGLGNVNGFKNVQTVTYDGQKYIYIMVSYGAGTNSGRIIRYNLSAINEDKLKIGELREIAYVAYRQLRTGKKVDRTEFKKYIKVGPKIKIGHGQTLAYNTLDNTLWMIVDEQDMDKKYTQKESVLQQIDPQTLIPEYTINYITKDENGKVVKPLHNLTFDNQGNFYGYVYQKMNGTTGIKLYQGQIDALNHVVKLKLVQVIKKNIGTNKQGIFFDPIENQLYLESDDALMKIPVNKLGMLTKSDIGYLIFNSTTNNNQYGREWEGGFFTASGQGYILMNKGVELLALTK